MKIVITGGHHSSAMPLIDLIFAYKHASKYELHWFGHKYTSQSDRNESLEYREITSLGIPFYELKAGKLYRNLNFYNLYRLFAGFFQAFRLLRDIRPNVIMSFGGYLSAPVVVAGWLQGVPVVIHEQTVVSGLANKFGSLFASCICLSWEESYSSFTSNWLKSMRVLLNLGKSPRIMLTGLPLRASVFDVRTTAFKIDNSLPTIYVTGGKSGSHNINRLILATLPKLLKVCNIIHQCGDHSKFNDFDQLNELYLQLSEELPGVYYSRKFVYENEIGEIFSKSQVVVSRAGAHIISELKALRKKAVLIPIPWVSHNEQYANAQVLVAEDLAVVLHEDTVTSEELYTAITSQLLAAREQPPVDIDYSPHSQMKLLQVLNEFGRK